MKDRKKIFEAVFFITVTVLALSVLFRGQNWSDLLLLIRKSNPVCLLSAVFLGLLFVCLEGYMIWRLLRLSGNDATLPGCIRYSFIGYFYSGITPSATGGQPAQLYEMCKDGNNASDSTVVLMVVALFYKLVLVVIGLMLPVVWLGHMREYLGSWLGLYVVGIVLNVVLVALLCGVMFSPGLILNIMCGVLAAGERCGIVKNGEKLRQDAAAFAGRYRETTHFLREHKGELKAADHCQRAVLQYEEQSARRSLTVLHSLPHSLPVYWKASTAENGAAIPECQGSGQHLLQDSEHSCGFRKSRR